MDDADSGDTSIFYKEGNLEKVQAGTGKDLINKRRLNRKFQFLSLDLIIK